MKRDSTFLPGDIRHHWPPAMVAGRIAAAARLSFLVKPNRTMAQAALRFVLAFPEISVAIPGAKTVAQVAENVGSADAPPLTQAEVQEARALYSKDFGL
jgi:aryl-alcohol dehydrogenase-like predicted oxidoreductase